MTKNVSEDFDKVIAEVQAAMDRGVRFGRSRLKQNGRIMSGGHGVTLAYARDKTLRQARRSRKARSRIVVGKAA